MSSTRERLLRRNGKPQSCEPCRKSKVRCDHTYPICNRCKSRNSGAQCVYRLALLTRPRGQSRHCRPASAGSAIFPSPDAPIPRANLDGDAGRARSNSDADLDTDIVAGGADSRGQDIGDAPAADDGRTRSFLDLPSDALRGAPITSPLSRPSSQFNFLGSASYPSVFAYSWKIGAAGSVRQ